MPHSHTCLKYHIVFSTKCRLPWITADLEAELHAYIGGIIRNKSGQIIEIGGGSPGCQPWVLHRASIWPPPTPAARGVPSPEGGMR